MMSLGNCFSCLSVRNCISHIFVCFFASLSPVLCPYVEATECPCLLLTMFWNFPMLMLSETNYLNFWGALSVFIPSVIFIQSKKGNFLKGPLCFTVTSVKTTWGKNPDDSRHLHCGTIFTKKALLKVDTPFCLCCWKTSLRVMALSCYLKQSTTGMTLNIWWTGRCTRICLNKEHWL